MADVGNAISPDMIRSILSAKGGADTPANIMSIKNFIASNPQQAEKYAMGMRGSSNNDDNMDILQLEKQMDKTNGIEPQGTVTVGDPQLAAPQPNVAAAPIAKQPPMMGPPLPTTTGRENPLDDAPQRGGPGVAGDGGGLWPLVLAILGGGAGASMYANRPNKNPSGAERGANIEQMALDGPKLDQKRIGYEPKLEDNMSDLSRLKTSEPAPAKVTNSPELNAAGQKAQVQAEVDAENAGARNLQEQMMQRTAGQNSTRDLLKKARGVTGRK